MTNSAIINQFIKQNNSKAKIKEKNFIQYIKEIEKESGFEIWIKNRKILTDSSSSYQDFYLYGILHIRFINQSKEFFAFIGELEDIYDLIDCSEEFPSFVEHFNIYVEILTKAINLRWNEPEKLKINMIQWLSNFYNRLKEHSNKVLISFKNLKIYAKDSNVLFKFNFCHLKGYVDLDISGNQIQIKLGDFTEDSLSKLEALIEEKNLFAFIKSQNLSHIFVNAGSEEKIIESILVEQFSYQLYEKREKLLKYLDEAVPSDLLETVLTSCKRSANSANTSDDYMSFTLNYFKCDSGYYVIDLRNKRAIFRETREEIFNYCLGKINLPGLKIK